jgi:hypothetical protein
MLDGNTPLGGDDPLGTFSDDDAPAATAALAQTLFGITQSATVVERERSTIAQTLFGISQLATVIEREPDTISTMLFGFSQQLNVVEREPAAIAQTLFGISQLATDVERESDTISTTLFAPTQAASAIEIFPSTIAQTLLAPAAHVEVVSVRIAQTFRRRFHRDLPPIPDEAHKPGISGIDKQKMAHEPKIHAAELEFFRGKVYARGVQAMVPPPVIAHHNLTTHQLPPSRPVVNRRPLRK